LENKLARHYRGQRKTNAYLSSKERRDPMP
jgi:hypothetical protein